MSFFIIIFQWIRFHDIFWLKTKTNYESFAGKLQTKKQIVLFIYLYSYLKRQCHVSCSANFTKTLRSVSPQPLRPSIAPLLRLSVSGKPPEGGLHETRGCLVGKWHLQLNAAGLPCQCVLVKYVQCHPVCKLFVIQIKTEKLHISISPCCVSAATAGCKQCKLGL